jgi:hypothetical protein
MPCKYIHFFWIAENMKASGTGHGLIGERLSCFSPENQVKVYTDVMSPVLPISFLSTVPTIDTF